MNWILTIVGTIIAAMIYSVSMYWKKSQEEEFDNTKFVNTLLFGLVVGIVAVVTKVQIENAYVTIASTGFVTVLIENIVAAIKRYFLAKQLKKKAAKKK